jgi:hypothetical protein
MEDESALLEAARRMDQAALRQIFDHYASPLFNYAWRLCGDPVRADHIVGDVFVKLLEPGGAVATNARDAHPPSNTIANAGGERCRQITPWRLQ